MLAGNPARDINNNLVPNQVTDGSGDVFIYELEAGSRLCVVVFVTPGVVTHQR